MPRTFLTKQQKLNKDLCAYIYGQMKVRRITQKEISGAIGITQPALSLKLKNGNFSFQDLAVVFGILKPDGETLKKLLGVEE